MRSFFRSLYLQVLLAILLGVLLGVFYSSAAVQLKPLGDGFVKLIKMVIAPVIFCSIVLGIASMPDQKKAGRVGWKALLYFEILTTLALLIGLLIINVWAPGRGMNVSAKTIDASAMSAYTRSDGAKGISGFFLHIIPESIIDAFSRNDMLQILFFAVLLGFGLSLIKERAEPFLKGLRALLEGLFAVIRLIMKLAPLGAFGAMAFTIGTYGLASLASLGQLMICFYITCILFIVFVLGSVMRCIGLSVFQFIFYLKDELLLVLGTSSSEAALPGLMQKLERAGCSRQLTALVVPTGYSFNLDGTCIYLTMAAIFLAQATNTPLTPGHQITLLLVLLLTSKGAAGVTGSGFITLAATLPVAGNIPVGAIALILGVDRFMSEGRALTNIIGNGVATLFISNWEGDLDRQKALHVFKTKKPVNARL